MATNYDPTRREVSTWWVYLLSGALLLFLGIKTFQYPGVTYLSLSLWFAAVIFVNGVSGILFAFTNRASFGAWFWMLVLGLGEAVLGFYLLAVPIAAVGTLMLFVGWWLLFRSFVTISKAFVLQQSGYTGWGWVLAAGIGGGLLAGLVLANPVDGAAGTSLYLTLNLLALGITSCTLAFRLHNARPEPAV